MKHTLLHAMLGPSKKRADLSPPFSINLSTGGSAKLVHRVVFATSLECSLPGKIFLVVIANIGTDMIWCFTQAIPLRISSG